MKSSKKGNGVNGGNNNRGRNRNSKKCKILKYVFLIVMIVGLLLVIYPCVSSVVNNINNESTYTVYENNVSVLSQSEKTSLLDKASKYNSAVSNAITSTKALEQNESILHTYKKTLSFDDDGLIGYIDIPKISLHLPFYHGTGTLVLAKGAGHIKDTAFPIGELNTHSALSAHTGYPKAVMFDNIDELKNGDEIRIQILDNVYIYKVCDSNIVDPDDDSLLQVQENKSLLTLVTCYPYSINTHRLLVTSEFEQVKNINDVESTESTDSVSRVWIIIVAVIIVLIISAVLAFIRHRRKRRLRQNEI